jgi:perosamine synthetase
MHRQPVFEQMGLADGRARPVSERLAAQGFYLPSGLGLDEAGIHRAAQALSTLGTVAAR